MNGERTFGCPLCGRSYNAYPPDDHYDTVSLDEEYAKTNATDGRIKKVIHDCDVCKRPITLYWYRQKIHLSFG